MAITASQIQSTNTLEQLRTEFNNLRDDVSGLESGTLSFSAISTTSISGTTLNVKSAETMTIKSETNIDMDSSTTTDITAGTILDLNSGGGSPSSTNVINLN